MLIDLSQLKQNSVDSEQLTVDSCGILVGCNKIGMKIQNTLTFYEKH